MSIVFAVQFLPNGVHSTGKLSYMQYKNKLLDKTGVAFNWQMSVHYFMEHRTLTSVRYRLFGV
jgi:hypothetical protein